MQETVAVPVAERVEQIIIDNDRRMKGRGQKDAE
jgi:hypothetical protein